ncbi:MAG: DNA adenine methylase [Bacteroidetes bacterium]|nr:MAG: DNA adenine methylase [Bacteroidota bacterium]
MKKNKLIAPFVKWVGGKRQLLPAINNLLPTKYTTYYEPFVGGGAVLFYIQPKKAVINDFNSELINVYNVIKNNPNELISDLKTHINEPEYYYHLRALDRRKDYSKLSSIKKASRIIYLNKTCYNGLYRVNNSGEFNSPFGRYKNPNIINETTIKAVNKYLNNNKITILNVDFENALEGIKKGAFVYFDPPYEPVSKSSNFTGYIQGGFNLFDQIRLRDLCIDLDSKGIKFLLSNSATPLIKDLYNNFNIKYVKAIRSINSNAKKRGEIDELLIRNYE